MKTDPALQYSGIASKLSPLKNKLLFLENSGKILYLGIIIVIFKESLVIKDS